MRSKWFKVYHFDFVF